MADIEVVPLKWAVDQKADKHNNLAGVKAGADVFGVRYTPEGTYFSHAYLSREVAQFVADGLTANRDLDMGATFPYDLPAKVSGKTKVNRKPFVRKLPPDDAAIRANVPPVNSEPMLCWIGADGEPLNVGEWDYKITNVPVMAEVDDPDRPGEKKMALQLREVALNPLPAGARQVTAQVTTNQFGGRRMVRQTH